MFLVRAFIKNNTIELRNKLEKIGYKNHGKSSNYGNLNCLYCACGSYFECNQLPARGTVVIDCGYNQDLFLAIAALNNETDKYQWFWSTGWHRISGEPLPDK